MQADTTIRYVCDAPDEVFLPRWDDVPLEHQYKITKAGGLPCEGGGIPGWWCTKNCPYFGGETEFTYVSET